MASVEERSGRWVVRWYVKGERTPSGKLRRESAWFDDEREARWFANGNVKSRFDVMQRRAREAAHGMDMTLLAASGRKKPTPKLSDYARSMIESDPNIEETTREACLATLENHVTGSMIDLPMGKLADDPDRTDPALLRQAQAEEAVRQER